jgi:hypothetical protein
MWIRRFGCLALMPIEKLKDAWEIIVNSIPIEKTETLVKFIKYVIDVWITGKKGNNTNSKLENN